MKARNSVSDSQVAVERGAHGLTWSSLHMRLASSCHGATFRCLQALAESRGVKRMARCALSLRAAERIHSVTPSSECRTSPRWGVCIASSAAEAWRAMKARNSVSDAPKSWWSAWSSWTVTGISLHTRSASSCHGELFRCVQALAESGELKRKELDALSLRTAKRLHPPTLSFKVRQT
jgi:hypothetical protein